LPKYQTGCCKFNLERSTDPSVAKIHANINANMPSLSIPCFIARISNEKKILKIFNELPLSIEYFKGLGYFSVKKSATLWLSGVLKLAFLADLGILARLIPILFKY
jgi:hypothetical protein